MRAAAERPTDTGRPEPSAIDPAAEAAEDFLRISSSPRSTERAIVLIRLLADPLESGMLALAADRLAGEARKPGRKPRAADATLLAKIDELRPVHGKATVGAVARAAYPGDSRAQHAAAQRLRRKIRDRKKRTLCDSCAPRPV